MSFDIDPIDKEERILCYHAESDNLFVVKSRGEFNYYQSQSMDDIDDVTGIDWAEKRFREEGQ